MSLNKDIVLLVTCLMVGSIIPMFILGIDYYNGLQDIQFHDTYIVFNPFEFVLVPIGFVIFLSFTVRGIITRFKHKLTIIFLGNGLITIALTFGKIYKIILLVNQ